MPHISIKMLKGRTDEQKALAVKKLTDALCDALGCSERHVSVSVEDFTAQEWQNVFAEEIANNPAVMKKPEYDPKDLL
ncbi:MAG: 4-oxalocrotonate tautomerase [Clostridiales bacterium]|jgi:4-oxalocrotonate tautomerase family enzyme|nr:4-oxalocrotonate tautomerase [Clostridiales bacterium]